MISYTETGQCSPVQPFDFSKSLDAVWGFNQMIGDPIPPSNKVVKVMNVEGKPYGVEVKSIGFVEEPHLEYRFFADESIGDTTRSLLSHRMNAFLGLEEDLAPFYEIAQTDTAFSPVVGRLYGYHPLKFSTPFEAACWAILIQRNLVPIASKMRLSILQAFGSGMEIEGTTYGAFPEADQLAQVSLGELIDCLGDEKKAENIANAAKAFAQIEESWLLGADFHHVENWLHNLSGIGFSSATMILTQGLGRMNRASFTDKRLLSAVHKVYGKSFCREDIPKLAELYGPWQGYWALYLSQFVAR
jgi:DNA-3-methyladenine glycosylase II